MTDNNKTLPIKEPTETSTTPEPTKNTTTRPAAKRSAKKQSKQLQPRQKKPLAPDNPRRFNGLRTSPVIGNNALNLNEGDNAKILDINITLFNMDKVNLRDPQAVAQRLTEYFALYARHDMKPTVAGMAMALGVDRHYLWAVSHNAPLGGAGNYANLPPETTHCIKKAYVLMENLWESYMNSSKINPVVGIFLGKNNFAYRDQSEHVITAQQRDETDFNAEEIAARYMLNGANDAETVETGFMDDLPTE